MFKFLNKAKKIAPELACYYAKIAEQEFYFKGSDPLEQSGHNHQDFMLQEFYAKKDKRIDYQFRKEAVEYIFKRWKARLKCYHPYHNQGFRLYAYYENVPGISVVAETTKGCPFQDMVIVDHLEDVLASPMKVPAYDPDKILAAIEKHKGSIGEPVANELGIGMAELRQIIERSYICNEVNAIRKKYKRSPADLVDWDLRPYKLKMYEEILPAGY